MTKKRIAAAAAMAAIAALTGATAFGQHKSDNSETQEQIGTQYSKSESYGQHRAVSRSETIKISTKDRWQITTQVPENKLIEITASSEEAKQQTAVNESFTTSEQTTLPPKPSQLQHGDINEKGEMYINGFGWVSYEGPNLCEFSSDMYENGNKIGYFG